MYYDLKSYLEKNLKASLFFVIFVEAFFVSFVFVSYQQLALFAEASVATPCSVKTEGNCDEYFNCLRWSHFATLDYL